MIVIFPPDSSILISIGYVQGMSDVLALPLMVLNNEHQAFWCFDSIMKTVVAIFLFFRQAIIII